MAPVPSDDVSDFSARTVIAGGFHGRRTFRIIRAGDGLHMHGPIFDGDWTPGAVNHATCQSKVTKPPHRPASQGCQCGYWAYLAEVPEIINYRNTWNNGLTIEGIIFGFGLCSVGPKGFRAEKATVKALIIPSEYRAHSGLDQALQEQLLADAMTKWPNSPHFRWYGTMDAALRDWPLSTARKYNLLPDEGAA